MGVWIRKIFERKKPREKSFLLLFSFIYPDHFEKYFLKSFISFICFSLPICTFLLIWTWIVFRLGKCNKSKIRKNLGKNCFHFFLTCLENVIFFRKNLSLLFSGKIYKLWTLLVFILFGLDSWNTEKITKTMREKLPFSFDDNSDQVQNEKNKPEWVFFCTFCYLEKWQKPEWKFFSDSLHAFEFSEADCSDRKFLKQKKTKEFFFLQYEKCSKNFIKVNLNLLILLQFARCCWFLWWPIFEKVSGTWVK